MSRAVSLRAHSMVVGIWPLALGCGRWPGWKRKPSSWPLLSRPGIWLLMALSHSVQRERSPAGVQPLEQVVGARCFDDLVVQRSHNALLEHYYGRFLGLPIVSWLGSRRRRILDCAQQVLLQPACRQELRLGGLAPLEDGVDGQVLE